MKVEIIYLASDKNSFRELISINENCDAEGIIIKSKLFDKHPELSLKSLQIGLFSKKIDLNYQVEDGDRIEIYRPLTISPMAKRRLLASKKK